MIVLLYFMINHIFISDDRVDDSTFCTTQSKCITTPVHTNCRMAGAGDWQLTCKEMTQRGANLLASGQWSDCTFLVGAEPNQILVRGHKLLLAMASPVFEAMFYGNMAERNDPISILDVQPDAFKALLEYIYTDNIDITSFDKACELCYGAKKYMLPHLVKECTKYLWSDLHPKNACRAYEFARLFEEPVLMDKCIQIICANTKEVLADSSFEEVELNTIMTVFSLDYLTIDSELDLFEAAVRYANAQAKGKADSPSPACDKQTMDASTSKVVNVDSCESPADAQEADAESPACKLTRTEAPCRSPECSGNTDKVKEVKEKPSIRSAVEQIRFLTLTPQQFAQGPALSSLLTESESFAVLMNILSSSSDIAMPSGFTTCRVPRKPLIGINNTGNIATFTVDTPSPVMVDHVCTKSTNNVRPVATSLLQPAFNQTLQSVANTSTAPPVLHPLMSVHMLPEHVERHASEFAKIYCQRPILQHTDCLNTSVLDCSVTFMVDKNICLLGVQVPTQVLSEESTVAGMVGGCGSSSGNNAYSELLYAHLLDADGARLTYTHYTSRVPYRCLLDIMFNRPVYIQRNKVYKVGIVFNKVGWYPMGTCAQQVPAENVYFNFGIGQTSDSVRDGLIRSIIFTY